MFRYSFNSWVYLRFGALALLVAASACNKAPPSASIPVEPPVTASVLDPQIGKLAKGEPLTSIAVEADDANVGEPDALVTVVAFLDYECSFCAQAFNTLLTLRDEFEDHELRIVMKHLPLEFHQQALPAAIVGQTVQMHAGSEAFFQFSRKVFANQSEIEHETLAKWARDVGVPRDLYNESVGDETTLRRVAQDAGVAGRAGVDSTPTFFVNGRLIAGAQDVQVFRQNIIEEIAWMKKSEEKHWRDAYRSRVTSNMRGSLTHALLAQDPNDNRVPVDGSPTQGNKDAPVTMVVFTDFECPFCKRAELTLGLLKKKYGSDLRIVFKHRPLPFHQAALPAARLSAAIYEYQGSSAFFSATAELFEASPDLSETTLKRIGLRHGLKNEQVVRAIVGDDPVVNSRISSDMVLADDVLARGTPHFFINGKRLSGARPLEHFEAVVEHERKRASLLVKQGTQPALVYETVQKGAVSPGLPQKLEALLPIESHPTKGPQRAPVAIHVFSDFQCPYCRGSEEALEELIKSYPEQIQVVWHDFPLEFHERARFAARAGREAFKQKGSTGFWQMHTALFGLGGDSIELSDEQILAHGKKIGMNLSQLKSALNSDEHDPAIDTDISMASDLGIRGTPAYVIGGYLVVGAKPLRYLSRAVELSLNGGASTRVTSRKASPKN